MTKCDPHKWPDPNEVWMKIRSEALRESEKEPLLRSYIYSTILHHSCLDDVLLFHLASKLGGSTFDDRSWMKIISDALEDDEAILKAACADIKAVCDRDPECDGPAVSLLFFKG